MFTDPLSVTVDGSAKSFPRTGSSKFETIYKTANDEYRIRIFDASPGRNGIITRGIQLARTLPDPTPLDIFDPYRDVVNAFALHYSFDLTRSNASVDLPILRTALLTLVDSTFQGRLIGGEK